MPIVSYKNAKIVSTMLGYEDRGILTCLLNLDYGGVMRGFGGYGLDEWDEGLQARVGSVRCGEFIAQILKVAGVDKWENLVGKHVRVVATYSKVEKIGNIIEDRWFTPTDLWKNDDVE